MGFANFSHQLQLMINCSHGVSGFHVKCQPLVLSAYEIYGGENIKVGTILSVCDGYLKVTLTI